MTGFRFAFLPAFLLLLPALLLWGRWWWKQRNAAPSALRYSDTRLIANLSVGLRVRMRQLPDVLRFAAWISIIFALAEPQSSGGLQTIHGLGVDIVISLDISSSMAEPDMNGRTRFEAAREVIQDFVSTRSEDRFGLVVFAEEAFYQSPLTLDHHAFSLLLDAVPLADTIGLSNRTAIGLGIASGVNMLRDSTGQSRVLLLTTDGTSNAGSVDPITAARAAAAYGIRIHAIALGSQDAPLESRPDTATLRQIANITGGTFYQADSGDGLAAIYDQIDQMEQSPATQATNIRWIDLRWLPAIIALLLLILERILRNTVFQVVP